MIRGLHGLLYSSDPDATRAFLRDKLQLAHTDVGGGWLIFDLPEADLGVHPVDPGAEGGTHDVSFYCDDIESTLAGLRSRGVEVADAADHGYGYVTYLALPGGLKVQLYQPKYQKAAKPAAKANAKAKAKAKPPKKAKAKPAKKPAKKPKKR